MTHSEIQGYSGHLDYRFSDQEPNAAKMGCFKQHSPATDGGTISIFIDKNTLLLILTTDLLRWQYLAIPLQFIHARVNYGTSSYTAGICLILSAIVLSVARQCLLKNCNDYCRKYLDKV